MSFTATTPVKPSATQFVTPPQATKGNTRPFTRGGSKQLTLDVSLSSLDSSGKGVDPGALARSQSLTQPVSSIAEAVGPSTTADLTTQPIPPNEALHQELSTLSKRECCLRVIIGILESDAS
ncbi:hypothetical protein CROQUDRAFT_87839 [Cronartium quercuum f. sp. fusiforme G11]|uniref:Uncharacterized protein n=1 Tax=Cronartium quercuum f. sp. fusiforme G11 TaxID=708437 RepID=A0A9P6NRH1_9BASI|nr:hypothetical protein CROQUDRAFT_87839 [Cronartium quercuum f. sp. fusiforme G11]